MENKIYVCKEYVKVNTIIYAVIVILIKVIATIQGQLN